jgi:transposase
LAKKLGLPVTADTLLRVIKHTPLPAQPTPRVLGVDDWAWKKSQSYGTILVDLERHQPIELLADREAQTLTEWLKAHPGVEIISRDRAGAYADGARKGAPQAIQVSDRFHIYKNLSETVERVVQRNYAAIKQVLSPAPLTTPPPSATSNEAAADLPLKWHAAQKQARLQHRLALYEQVRQLAEQGYNLTEIAEELEISRRRVRVLLKNPPQLKAVVRPSKVDPYKPYLQQRFLEDGCHNASQLWREVVERGYAGAKTPIINYVTQLRQQLTEPAAERTGRTPNTQPQPLSEHLYSPRQITRWFIQDKAKLRVRQQAKLANLCQNVADLAVTQELVEQFRAMFEAREAQALTDWLERAEACGVAEVVSFARGMKPQCVTA